MTRKVDPDTGEVTEAGPIEEGIWLVGPLLGVKHPEPYDIDGRKGVSKRKIGVSIYGQAYSVVAETLDQFEEAIGNHRKGDVIALRAFPVSGRFGLRWSLSPSSSGSWE